jgi:hypothetical protein
MLDLNPSELLPLLEAMPPELLENSIVQNLSGYCEQNNFAYTFIVIAPGGNIEVQASKRNNPNFVTHRDPETMEDYNKREFLSAYFPGLGQVLETQSQEDKDGFFEFFEEFIKKSFIKNGGEILLFDSEKKFFALKGPGTNNVWAAVKITGFIDVISLISKLANNL